MSATLQVLIVLASHAQMGAITEPTGFWLERFTTPYLDFQPFAVADGNLVIGQNPASSGKAAELAIGVAREAR